ncbi:MAG: metallophosphoesterase [Anaerostipes sp.]|jgi:predicted MPP superfamily phosphohydrolase
MIYIIIILLLILLAIVILSIRENQSLELESYDVVSSKLPEAFDGFKIIFLTDLHSNEFGFENERLHQLIDDAHPDVIVVGGDMIVGRPEEDLKITLEFMSKLSKKYRIYCGDGNHELRLSRMEEVYGVKYKEYVSRLKEAGVIHLSDEGAFLDNGIDAIRITGLDLEFEQYKKFKTTPIQVRQIIDKIGVPEEDFFQILLAHNPNGFKQYANWGADLVLSGHYHGGMVRIPMIGGVISPQLQLFPKYDSGKYTIGKSTMILSRGLGNHSIKIRLWNKPEVSLITLRKAEDEHGD